MAQRQMLLGKIHRVRVTEADLNYIGSVSIDADLLAASGILPFEKVLVVDVDNGERFETYAIEGKAGSGTIGINGGAARRCHVGDRVLIFAFALMDEKEARTHRPNLVFVDENNRPLPAKPRSPRATS